MFPLLRHYSIASLVAVLSTTLLIAVLHHLAEREQLLDLGEGNHIALTQSFANTLLPSFRQLAATTRGIDDAALRAHPLVAELRPQILTATAHTKVVKVKFYDLNGRTIFSTDPAQIGKISSENAGFRSAARGVPISELTHRQRFSAFDREIVDRDVLSSYVALRASSEAPIEGVLEVYSDLTEWVGHIDRQARLVALATICALSLLYGALYFIVRRADRLIGSQYEALQRSESELSIAATVFESREPMLVADAATNIVRVNKALTDATRFAAEQLVGRKLEAIGASRHEADFYLAIRDSVAASGGWCGELWLRRGEGGEEFPVWCTLTAVQNARGAVTHCVGTLIDMTDRVRAEEQVRQLAFHDPLTGLPNRLLLRDRLLHAMSICVRSGRHGALMFLDLDRFKQINDELGHEVGDLLLKEVAARLQRSVRECDTVARWGGDEFIVMLENLDPVAATALAQLQEVGNKILAELNQTFYLNHHLCHNTPSVGATLFRGQGESLDGLLKQADEAMYRAKNLGRNRMVVFGSK
jgi:diguanylate cyclase (GGDEF)-like protein/PAS domain S-box-containing protein